MGARHAEVVHHAGLAPGRRDHRDGVLPGDCGRRAPGPASRPRPDPPGAGSTLAVRGLLQFRAGSSGGHLHHADLLRSPRDRGVARPAAGGRDRAHAQYGRVQRRDLAGGDHGLPARTARGGASHGHDRERRLSTYRVPPDLACEPPRARERDDAPHQGEPSHRDHRRRRLDPEGASDRGHDLRAAAAVRGSRRGVRAGPGAARRGRPTARALPPPTIHDPLTLRLDVIWKEWLPFALGLGHTVWLCAVSMLLSLLLGVLFMVPLMSRHGYVRGVARTVVDGGRCVPFLLLTYLVYYALPSLGLSLDKWTAALITLVIYNTAYMAEILRAGWVHLPQGQTEAGRVFGHTGIRLFRRIILPQVLIAVGPVVGNQLIQLIKDSA